MAPDTSSCWATPATSSVMPNTVSRNVSSLPPATRLLIRRPYLRAARRITDTATSAIETLVNVATTVPPTISAATTGKVDRHRQVLDHQEVQHGRRLAEAEATEVGQRFADHARRRDPRDAAQQHGRQRIPPEEQTERHTGQGIQCHVDQAGRDARLQSVAEFALGVLQAERKEQ